jgi:hypothetical protein
MNPIDHIRQLATAGITSTAEIADLIRRGIEPPTTDTAWTAEHVPCVCFEDACKRVLPT